MYFFPKKLIKACGFDMEQKDGPTANKEYILGVDFARAGEDETVMMIAEVWDSGGGFDVVKIVAIKKSPLNETIGRIKNLNELFQFSNMYMDESSVGGGGVDFLLEAGLPVLGCDFKMKKKAEIYNQLILMMENGKVRYPNNKKLLNQLLRLTAKYDTMGLHLSAPAKEHDDYTDALALLAMHFLGGGSYSGNVIISI